MEIYLQKHYLYCNQSFVTPIGLNIIHCSQKLTNSALIWDVTIMQIIIKKGHNINLAGQPAGDIEELTKPEKVGILPGRIPFIKPRLKATWGDRVKIGTPLFEDKRNPNIVFLSPGCGRIEAINFGKRRVIQEIVISLDKDEKEEQFKAISANGIDNLNRDELIDMLLMGGLWQLLRELPFRDIANYESIPPSIIISLDSMDYFQPSSDFYLSGNEELFMFGLKLMQILSEKVYISSSNNIKPPRAINNIVSHNISGKYPADDPGVLLYHIKKTSKENNAWFINGQDLLLIATLIKTGRYPTEKLFAVAGTGVDTKRYIKTRIGSPASHIATTKNSKNKLRFISGGTFRGYTIPADSYIGFYESSLTILPEGDDEEFFGFLRPGYKRQSYSKTFLSFFNTSKIDMNCNLHGELRACINCSTCEKVCPVDIYPQHMFKCIEADEIEEALVHGLLDCVECGLCTYVCPSKIEITEKFKIAKAEYYKDRA